MRAHPRSRGENDRPSIQRAMREGSSLLTRGKRAQSCLAKIPPVAHPRSRGENTSRPGSRASPPWLIPAHAGKTSRRHAPCRTHGAHPRSRGENSQAQPAPAQDMGSSPLTRGKHAAVPLISGLCGLIPAHAGKTVTHARFSLSSRAHPRSRGENDLTDPIIELMPGSSPLTRGKRQGVWDGIKQIGLIPAHAGKTPCFVCRYLKIRAHPRSRGENAAQHRAERG